MQELIELVSQVQIMANAEASSTIANQKWFSHEKVVDLITTLTWLAHVSRIYGLLPSTQCVSDLLEHNVEETKRWVEELGLPYANKGFIELEDLACSMKEEADNEESFKMFILYVIGRLFKPLSKRNVCPSYLGIFFRRDSPDFKALN
ncbi:hypothetical protein LINPERHAP1_LOCUS7472 [Linum perenne]